MLRNSSLPRSGTRALYVSALAFSEIDVFRISTSPTPVSPISTRLMRATYPMNRPSTISNRSTGFDTTV
jgi:hypothetical protein